MAHLKGIATVLMVWLFMIRAHAQMDPAFVQQSLEKELSQYAAQFKYAGGVKHFYAMNRYRVAWMNREADRRQLFLYLDSAQQWGLKKEDYQGGFINSFRSKTWPLNTAADSLAAEFRFTGAAIHFFHDVAMGNEAPAISYNGLHYRPACLNIETLLSTALQNNRLDSFIYDIELKSPEYLAVKHTLNQFLKLIADSTAQGKEHIKPNKMTMPPAVRVAELGRALNTLRWLHCIRQQYQHIIVVNIPSANLLVYGQQGVVMESRVVVGKKSTRTPVLCSIITEVILYPYWMVPKKIATRELLPLIKKNTGFLDANKIQVINEQGRVISPSAINWHVLSVNYFPYTLRQSTGCDNSLGIIKFNFYNPYSVFLHDTPWKSFFKTDNRFYSHGCIRVEKAIELAHLVLKDNTIAIDTLEEKGCLRNQKPVPVAASEKMPLFVLYNTAWVDSAATVRFYADIYNRFPLPKK